MTVAQTAIAGVSTRPISPLGGVAIAATSAVSVVPGLAFSAFAVAAIVALPMTFSHAWTRHARWLMLGLAWWIFASLVSVITTDTAWTTGLANSAYPLAVFACFALFMYLTRLSVRRLLDCVVYVGIGLTIGAFVQPVALSGTLSPLKLGAGLGISLFTIAVISILRPPPLVQVFCVASAGVAMLAFDFRSMGLILVVSSIPAAIAYGRSAGRRLRVHHLVGLFALICATAIGLVSALQSGWFGQEVQSRFLAQSTASASILEVARPETVVSLIALRSSWLGGRGFGADLTSSEAAEAIHQYTIAGIPLNDVQFARILGNGINSHSLFFTLWIATGVMGAIAIAAICAHVIRGALAALNYQRSLAYICTFAAILLVWDALFSPWNVRGEVWLGLAGALATSAIAHAARSKAAPLAEASRAD